MIDVFGGAALSGFGIDCDKWAKRYGLEPFSAPCDSCGAVLKTTIPIAVGSLRGLRAPMCTCGCGRPPYCVVESRMRDLLG